MTRAIDLLKYQIVQMTSEDLRLNFDDFFMLFEENFRGHLIDEDISKDYILQKANELFPYLENQKALLFGTFFKNKLIGFLWAYYRMFLLEDRLYINALIINEKYRGKGLGKVLFSHLEEFASNNNVTAIDVSTASFKNEAIRFYEKMGFKHERVQLRKAVCRK
jgi:ribosomal protein S18 acetylase RimI-like enzyme